MPPVGLTVPIPPELTGAASRLPCTVLSTRNPGLVAVMASGADIPQ
jgi:hypothetical protein